MAFFFTINFVAPLVTLAPLTRETKEAMKLGKRPVWGGCVPVDIAPTKISKGDDERFKEDTRRCPAPKRLRGNITVQLDPSKGKEGTTVPVNEPPLGKVDDITLVLPEQRSEDVSELSGGGRPRSTDPDNVEHSHLDEKHDMTISAKQKKAIEKGSGGAVMSSGAKPGPGQLGTRNIENSDLLGATASGFSPSDIGDAIVPSKGTMNSRNDSLRPMYGMANPVDIIPDTRSQLKSDMIFDDFHIVAPGFGLGVTNPMFLMEQARDKQIIFREPLAFPRTYQGPSGLVEPSPVEWNNEIGRRARTSIAQQDEASIKRMTTAFMQVGQGTTNVLGNDSGWPSNTSDKGLNRARESVLEPIISIPHDMERTRLLTGQQLNTRQFRRLWDPERLPERFDVKTGMEGGPTMSRQRAYTLLPFPPGTG